MNPTPEELKDSPEMVFNYVNYLIKEEGKQGSEVRNILMEKGIDQNTAYKVVAYAENKMERGLSNTLPADEGGVGAGTSDMFWGAVWCIGGIVVTLVTYSNASGGGTYVVAWGAILFGGIQFFRGLMANS